LQVNPDLNEVELMERNMIVIPATGLTQRYGCCGVEIEEDNI
jgi:hypothetical protein